jgi:serine/threonine protein kinase/tetratricopeptide (TPR) repeat protein
MTELLEPSKGGQPIENWYGLQVGTLLAERYRVERLISRGGMGAVFEATQLGLDRSVAVKVLLPSLSRDDRMQERFRREAKSAAALRHPNIIQIYDYGISDHGPYIVMEFLRGHSLHQLLSSGALTIAQAVNLMEQICSAIASAHAAGIIHRDLKPDNIVIERNPDGTELAKVLDFGIAKMRELEAEESDTRVTNLTGANIIGSPAYMSPEQSMGMELDERSDVYALGIVLYEMLTGQTPFGKASAGAMLVHQVNTNPRSVKQLRTDIPEAIEAVVMKALAKDRQLRFATVTEFAQQLRRAFDDPAAYTTQTNLLPTAMLEDSFATSMTPLQNTGSRRSGVNSGSLSAKQRRRLAILPLRNLMGDPQIDFLGFALADSIITQLAPLESLIVRPSSAVEKYRNQVAEPAVVGRELQVDTILSGSYLKAGELFRVTVQLIDAPHNEILWQEMIDLKFDNVITLQDKICEEVIRGLKLNVSTNEQEALKREEVRNPMAYEFYLRGLAQGNTAEEHKQAVEMLEASVGLDPQYAPAWAALAGRYINARGYLQNDTMFGKAEIAARKAIELNPRLPSGFFWLAVYYGEKGDLKNALSVCKQLLQVAPNSEYAYQAMGHVYDYAGLPDISLTLFRKAAEINPVAFPYMIGFIQYQKGNFAEARKELAACPDTSYEKHYWLAAIELIEGNRDKAMRQLETLLESGQTGVYFSSVRGLLWALRGEAEEGKRIIDEAFASGLQLGAYHFYIAAEVYAQLGDEASAIQMLNNVVQAGYGNYPFLISDPLLAPVRETDGFAEVARTMQELQTKLQLMLVTD